MYFTATHRTTFAYSAPVFIEPKAIRLHPRSDPFQTVLSHSLEMSPEPAGRSTGIDAHGNDTTWAWFSGLHDRLEITTRFLVATHRTNPFDFIAPISDGSAIPPAYTDGERVGLAPYLAPSSGGEVASLAKRLADDAGGEVMGFLQLLTSEIYESIESIVRMEGDAMGADETLETGQGSCRDLAMLFVEVCRHAGIAARFVSGYQEGDPDQVDRELHAWASAYMPGGGWRGFDPTHGLVVSDRHVTLAVGAGALDAAPTSGNYRGDAMSELSYEIHLTVSERNPEATDGR